MSNPLARAAAAAGVLYGLLSVVVLSRRVSRDVTNPPDAGRSAGGTAASAAGAKAEASLRERAVARLRPLASSHVVLALALLALVTAIASWGVTSYAVVLLTDGYGVPAGTANLALTGAFVAGALAMLVGGELSDRIAPGPVILVSFAAVTVLVAVVATTAVPPALAVAGVVLVGAARSVGLPARSKLADDVSARGDLGRNFAVITIGIMLGGAVAPPVFGAIVERTGPGVAFYAIAAVGPAATLLVAVILRTYRGRFERAAVASAAEE